MNLPRIKIRKTGRLLKRLLLSLGERAFLIFLGLLVIALIFGAIIYYRYNILAKREEAQVTKEPFQFQEKTYQNISRIWQKREKKFEESGSKEYPNLFRANQFEEVVPEEHFDSTEINESEETVPEESSDSSEIN
jgi:cbb3-type cytochrome oxidase subunit 3